MKEHITYTLSFVHRSCKLDISLTVSVKPHGCQEISKNDTVQ